MSDIFSKIREDKKVLLREIEKLVLDFTNKNCLEREMVGIYTLHEIVDNEKIYVGTQIEIDINVKID